jgi:DnaJ family protein C protein 2
VYGPVFERNLRFAVREKPKDGNSNNKKGKKKGNDFNTDNPLEGIISCPPFGDDNTSIEQVQQFYDYWTHFNSWRDFSLKAQEITKHNLDMADNRDEKRWMAKEVVRKMKNLKKQEVTRIGLLVERAVAADPRLRRSRDEERETKLNAKKEREEKEQRQQKELKEKEESEKKEAGERESNLKEVKAKEKVIQQKLKKELRKARQLLRRILFKAFETEQHASENNADSEPLWGSLEQMNDDVEFLCEKLAIQQMTELTRKLGGADGDVPDKLPDDMIDTIEDCLQTTKGASEEEKAEQKAKRDEARIRLAEKEALKKEVIAAVNPWTKEEIVTLGKSIRKYPAGGANRWETIAQFINNSLSLSEPRTKEECIAQYNETLRTFKPATEAATTTEVSDVAASGSPSADEWTTELDAKLQEGLKKFPASMEKNERWTSISTHMGKPKKDCVQRFKTIREALKNKK